MVRGTRERLQIIIAGIAGVAFMMEQLDATIITTVTPQIAASLGQNPLRINLAITSYLLTLITFMPASGWLADRFGAKRVFCLALAVFTLGSALCGLSTSLTMLLAMRMLQGLGGGLMTPVGRSLLLRAFPRSQLVKAMTWFNIPVVVGPTIGPVIGGLISTYATWPWIFYINIPFGVLGVLTGLRYMPDLKRSERPDFDIRGFLLAGAALIVLQGAVQGLGLAVIPWGVIGTCLAVAGALLGVYIVRARHTVHPILDVTLLKIRTFRIGVLAGGMSRIGINGLPYLLPLMLQIGFGKSALESGLLVSVTCVGIVLVRPAVAPLLRWLGFGRLLVLNTLAATACIAAFASLNRASGDGLIFGLIFIFSLARGMQFATLNTLSYADIPRERLSSSTSLGGVVQQITMGFGVSISAALLQAFSGPTGLIDPAAFRTTFIVLAVIAFIATGGFLTLRPQDGSPALPVPA
jgi:EmrB/QacA subfamily drug resistance transporter